MREKNIITEDSIRDVFEEFSETSRVDQEQIHKITATNEAMVELCHKLTDMSREQLKQIRKIVID